MVHTAGHGQGEWRVSGRTTETPLTNIISIPLARAPDLMTEREGAWEGATIIDCAYPTEGNGATFIDRLEYSNVLRVGNQILLLQVF